MKPEAAVYTVDAAHVPDAGNGDAVPPTVHVAVVALRVWPKQVASWKEPRTEPADAWHTLAA